MERIRPKAKCCTQQSFEDLVLAMNSRPDVVVVPMDALDDVFFCHKAKTGKSWQEVFPSVRRIGVKYFSVRRADLFNFVQQHGKICSHG